MFEDRGHKRTFYSAPQSVTSLIAAFLEPTITVLIFLAVSAWFDEPIGRSDLTLCLLIFALTFPGRSRFWDRPLNAAVDIT
ncbi:MAG TPA: undecaprenyl-phosphate glucose phosphotransferase, partial [Rubrivivax sp.]|nr:undecaprenyl-phosphate glucose phosphotransferase [Rubrivivax sp.]